MRKAFLALRYTVPERREAFKKGLQAVGYAVEDGFPTRHEPEDVFLTWNRIGQADEIARRYNGTVLVAENASWGNDFQGKRWYHIARNFHNTSGCFQVGGHSRWDDLGVDLAEWRTGGETVVFLQRGIGPKEVACPNGWTAKGRIRRHPGTRQSIPLEIDLANCGKVVTWGSGAAIKALALGIPVESHMPGWIGEQDNTDSGRLAMFRRLAWAQWTLEEITQGVPFANHR